MSTTLPRASMIVVGLIKGIALAVGAAPVGAGYRIDLSSGTSRAATQAEIDAATAWADAQITAAAADETATGTVKGDPQVAAALNMTPAQAEAWIDANVTTIAGARVALKILLKLVILLARRAL